MREEDEIIKRLMLLHTVLQWSTVHPGLEVTLTVGERIMVNQERGALFRELENEPHNFVQSHTVEAKITRIEYLIKRHNWKPKDL